MSTRCTHRPTHVESEIQCRLQAAGLQQQAKANQAGGIRLAFSASCEDDSGNENMRGFSSIV